MNGEFPHLSHQTMMSCVTCCVAFSVPVEFKKYRANDSREFYCPNGHANFFHHAGDTRDKAEILIELKALKRENVGLRAQLDQANAELERIKNG